MLIAHGYHDEWADHVDRVRDARPDVILVGMGAPNEMVWAHEWSPRIGRGLVLTCGGWFGFLAGEERRAPRLIRRPGLEWIGRVAQQPWRLGPRYARGVMTTATLSLHVVPPAPRQSVVTAWSEGARHWTSQRLLTRPQRVAVGLGGPADVPAARPDARGLASVLRQDYPGDLEVVVVFDHTTPDLSLEQRGPGRRVRVIDQRPAARPGRESQHRDPRGHLDLVAFLDDDDTWLPGKLTRQVSALLERPTAQFATTAMQVDYDGGLHERRAGVTASAP